MFSDIAQHWASECILALAKRQLISGYPNGTFRPNAVVNRAEFAALMQRVFPELIEKRQVTRFPDVLPEYWASGSIIWAAQRGLFSGYEDGRFLPRRPITRVQAVVVLEAALAAEQASEAVSAPEAQSADQQRLSRVSQAFSDADKIPAYAKEAIGSALQSGLLETLSEPRIFNPNQSLTRGEAAGLLCRALSIPEAELVRKRAGLNQPRQDLFKGFVQQEAGFNAEKLAFLDSGIRKSPYRKDISKAAVRLQQPDGISQTLENTAAYPSRGDRPSIDAGGLDFLSPNILSGCMCMATTEGGQLKARWIGREPFSNRQMWSSTKFIPLLNVVDRANATAPTTDVDRCLVRPINGRRGFPFKAMAASIMSYDYRVYGQRAASSNALAAMFKHFNTPTGLEKWTRQLTGNQSLSFQGRYGEEAFIDQPELWDPRTRRVLVKSPRQKHRGQNLVSTYDLTRLITMAGWHWRLPRRAIIPNVQTHSLESVVRAMGVDTARYVDVALKTLGLSGEVRSPVILSKSGFGRSDGRDRTELTYCVLAQFSLPRANASDPTASHQHYAFGLTLIAEKRTGNGHQEARSVDALMAAEVTEIIRRMVKGQL